MSDAENQTIVLDGEILLREVKVLDSAVSELQSAAGGIKTSMSGVAFGSLSEGILVPAITSLASKSRELLAATTQLATKMHTATSDILTAFEQLEDEAAEAFSKAAAE